jgi:thioesterase domain-containing protein
VVLLDPWIPEPSGNAGNGRSLSDAVKRARRLLARHGERPLDYLHWLAFVGLFHVGARDTARRLLHRSSRWLQPRPLLRRRIHYLRRVRLAALRGWRPKLLRAPVLLAVSDEHAMEAQMAAWQSVCPNHQLARLRGRHFDMLGRETLDQLLPILRDALGAPPAPVSRRSAAEPARLP